MVQDVQGYLSERGRESRQCINEGVDILDIGRVIWVLHLRIHVLQQEVNDLLALLKKPSVVPRLAGTGVRGSI